MKLTRQNIKLYYEISLSTQLTLYCCDHVTVLQLLFMIALKVQQKPIKYCYLLNALAFFSGSN